MCGHCYQSRLRIEQPVVRTWADVRGVRSTLLARSDWTQLGDIPEATKAEWTAVRLALRDITVNYPTPNEAMAALRQIEQQHFA